MRSSLVLATWVLLATTPAFAQDRGLVLHGRLLATRDGEKNPMPLAGVHVTVVESGQSDRTDTEGRFRIPLPPEVRVGQEVTLRHDAAGYAIVSPLFGKQVLPADPTQSIELLLLPEGSRRFWSSGVIEEFIARIARESAKHISGQPSQEADLSASILALARTYGFTPEEVRGEIAKWVENAQKDVSDFRKQGIAAFAKKNFRLAGARFRQGADQEEALGVEHLRQAAKERELSGDAFYCASDFPTAMAEYQRARESLRRYRESLGARADAVYPEYAADDRLLTFKAANAEAELGRSLEGTESLEHLRASAQKYRTLYDEVSRTSDRQMAAAILDRLGVAYLSMASRLSGGEAESKLNEAVAVLRRLLSFRTRADSPRGWAMTQYSLGTALRGLGERRDGEGAVRDLIGAVTAFRDALAVYDRETLPQEWAAIQNSLGSALQSLAEREFGAKAVAHLSEAVAAFRLALEVRTREDLPQDWAVTKNNLGSALWSLGELQGGKEGARLLTEALEVFRQALAVPIRDKFPLQWAATQNNLGSALQRVGEGYGGEKRVHWLTEAVQTYRQALAVYTRDTLPRQWAMTQSNLGNALWLLGEAQSGEEGEKQFAQAAEAYRAALSVYDRTSAPQQWATIHSNLGTVLRSWGERRGGTTGTRLLGLSVDSQRLALTVFTRDSLPQRWATTQRQLGDALYSQGARLHGAEGTDKIGMAIRAYREALTIYTHDAAPELWAATQGDLGLALKSLGVRLGGAQGVRRISEAVEAYGHALTEYTRNDSLESWSIIRYRLGRAEQELGDFQRAKDVFAETVQACRASLGYDSSLTSMGLINLGRVQEDLGQYDAAKATYEELKTLLIHTRGPNHAYLADILNELGDIQLELHDPASAMKRYDEALSIYRKAFPSPHKQIASCLSKLGNAQLEVGQYQAARVSYERALAIYEDDASADNHPQIATTLYRLGHVERESRNYQAAAVRFRDAIAFQRRALPEDDPRIGMSLVSLAWATFMSDGRIQDAVTRLAEATDLFAANQLRQGVVGDEREQLSAALWDRTALNNLIDATIITGGVPELVYDRVLRAKGLLYLQQRWFRQVRKGTDPETARLVARLRRVIQQIERRSEGSGFVETGFDELSSMRSLFADRDALERELTEHSEVYCSVQAQARVGTKEILAALPPDTALVDIVRYFHLFPPEKGPTQGSEESRLVAFVLRPSKEVVMVPLGPSNPINDLIDRWQPGNKLDEASRVDASQASSELRRRLWEPLARHLDGVKTVLISPDGRLNELPWAALPGSGVGTFLVSEYAFAVVPIPRLLPELLRDPPRRVRERPSMLLAGGISFGEEKPGDPKAQSSRLPAVPVIAPLPGSEHEVNELRAQFESSFPNAPATTLLVKDHATKEAVLAGAPGHQFIHLATRNLIMSDTGKSAAPGARRVDILGGEPRFRARGEVRHPGLLTGLVFAGVNRLDRPPVGAILTAMEASQLDWHRVELLVLSSCEGRPAEHADGGGLLGLEQAFQVARVRSTLVSLWRLSEKETQPFLHEFYWRVWSERSISKAEALRQAQLWMIRNAKPGDEVAGTSGSPSAFSWSAFVLCGDWR